MCPFETDLLGSEPDVPHVVADGLGGRHGAGQLPGLDDRRPSQLNGLLGRRGRGINNQQEGRSTTKHSKVCMGG